MPSTAASAGRFATALPDRAAGLTVQLDREVGDAAGGDIGGHVKLAPADDAEVDHALPRRGVEALLGGRQAGVLEGIRQLAEGLAVVDPTEDAAERPELLA